jgi:hypothetical protein
LRTLPGRSGATGIEVAAKVAPARSIPARFQRDGVRGLTNVSARRVRLDAARLQQ